MGDLAQFPSKMIFGLYGLSEKSLREGYRPRVFSKEETSAKARTLIYNRIADSPQMRDALTGKLLVPKMTPEGMEVLMENEPFDKTSSVALIQAFDSAREDSFSSKPHIILFKIGSHYVNDISYERDCMKGDERVVPNYSIGMGDYYLRPSIVEVFKIFRINDFSIKARHPSFFLKDVTMNFP